MIQTTMTQSLNDIPKRRIAKSVQQRQILSMMDIDVWVQKTAKTMTIDDSVLSTVSALDSNEVNANPLNTRIATAHVALNSNNTIETAQATPLVNILTDKDSYLRDMPTIADNNHPVIAPNVNDATPNETQPTSPIFVQHVEATTVTDVAPFELFAAAYRDWVLVVDSQALVDAAVRKLWQSIVVGLSLEVAHLAFPICEGITDKSAAQASVDGFVFHVANHASSQVASLTALPQGISHQNLAHVPRLTDMLIDPDKKRQLWSLLSQQSD